MISVGKGGDENLKSNYNMHIFLVDMLYLVFYQHLVTDLVVSALQNEI